MIVGETGGYLYPSTVTGFKGKINCLNIGSNAIYIRQGKAPDGPPHIAYRHGTVQAVAENRFSLSDVCDYKRNIRCIVRCYDR